MRLRPQRGSSTSEQGGGGVFENLTDSFLNAFTKVHKPDKRFMDVLDRSSKLDEDLSYVEKIFTRVARREGDLETDYADLAAQFQRLMTMEPGVEEEIKNFSQGVEATAAGLKGLREHTDQNYLVSLRDMEAYIVAVKELLRTREQKQLDFEALTNYLNKAATDRDILASSHGSSALTGPGGFLRSKIEDVRGVDHEQARREKVRKLELQIDKLTREVEEAKKTTEAFDEEVVKEVDDFERIKAAEMRDTLGGLADANVQFYKGQIGIWEEYLKGIEVESVGGAQ
jgi:sorting nexin-4